MQLGRNVLCMTWKERFVQFSWKAHCFPVLVRIWGQCNDFENFNAQKCDFAKTCCAWPRKCVSCFIFAKPAKNRLLRQKRLYFRKSCSKWQNGQNGIILAKSSQNCVLAEMALFWQNMLKTVVLAKMAFFSAKAPKDSDFAQNCLNLRNAAQNCVILPKWLYFGKTCSKPSFKAKTAWF